MSFNTNYSENTKYNQNALAPRLPAWQLIAYGEIDQKTTIQLTSCCKLFQSTDFSPELENLYWKRQFFNEFKYKENVNELKTEIIWKKLFGCLKNAERLNKDIYLFYKEVNKTLTPYSDFLSALELNAKIRYSNAYLRHSIEDFIRGCEISANTGCAPAQNAVGQFYYYNDRPKAFKYFQLSAEQGNARGQLGVGDCYDQGYGINLNTIEAFNYYLLSANQGNAVAQWKVGNCYRYGRGVKKDDEEAFKFYKLSAEKKNSVGLLNIAECYEKGIGVTANLAKAFEYYKQAELVGNAVAREKVNELKSNSHQSSIHNCNTLVPYISAWQSIAYGEIDPKTAIKLTNCCKLFQSKDFSTKYENIYWKRQFFNEFKYKKNVAEFPKEIVWKNVFCDLKKTELLKVNTVNTEIKDLLIPHSYFLSSLKPNAKIVYYKAFLKNSIEDFINDCELSADQGFAPAQATVGELNYSNDKAKALKYLELSAELGNARGQLGAGDYFSYGKDRNLFKAFNYYLLSANQGNAEAQWKVGDCYFFSRGVVENTREALKFYELSAAQSNPTGLDRLADCYEKGINVEVNFKKAAEYYDRAVAFKNAATAQEKSTELKSNYNQNYIHNLNTLVPYFQAWQQIVSREINPKTAIKLTTCCKLFQSKNFASTHENTYWKRQFINEFKFKEDVDESTLKIVWKNAFCDFKKAEFFKVNSYNEEPKKILTPHSELLSKLKPNAKIVYYTAFLKDSDNDFIKDYELIADEGFALAQAAVGEYYLYEDKVKALKYFKLSAEQGNARGQLGVGDCLSDGKDHDFSKAFNYYLLSANQGNAEAQWIVGNYYSYGLGMDKDDDKAFEFYRLSAEKSNLTGVGKLANCYEKGIGVEIDLTKALEYYKQAARLGNAFAKEKLVNLESNLNQHSLKEL